VVWGPAPGQIRQLAPLTGDTVGMALWINDNGQAVGASGTCANSALPPLAYGPHAVLWDKDGTPHDLGNLGGSVVNMALSVNNQGQVVGVSSLSAKSEPNVGTNAFLWNKQTGMQNLGTLPGQGTNPADSGSVALGITESGVVIGASFDAEGNPRAFVWQNGTMSDLNTLVPDSSPLYLLFAEGINSSGEIAGFGLVKSTCMGDPNLCEIHGFLAIPNNLPSGRAAQRSTEAESNAPGRFVPSEDVRAAIRKRLPVARIGSTPGAR
jgi:probable HAF family extracellular repeat protein